MSDVLDEVLTANRQYVEAFGDKGSPPQLGSKRTSSCPRTCRLRTRLNALRTAHT